MKNLRNLIFLSLVTLILSIGIIKFSGQPEWKILNQSSLTVTPTIGQTRISFSFAVISDIHTDLKNLQATLDRIQKDKMDFMIIAGDLTTLGKAEELIKVKTVLDKNGIPYYVLPGNHDLWSIKGGNNPFENIFGADYQSFLKDNVKFILINNGDGVIGIDEVQQQWIDREIADCPKLYCLVFAHMPLNNGLLKHIMGEDSLKVRGQAENLVKEFVQAQVVELFAGHIHYLSTYTLDGLTTITDGAIKDSPRFIEVMVTQPETKIEEKRIWLE